MIDDCKLAMCLFLTKSGGSSYQGLEEVGFDQPQYETSEGVGHIISTMLGGHWRLNLSIQYPV